MAKKKGAKKKLKDEMGDVQPIDSVSMKALRPHLGADGFQGRITAEGWIGEGFRRRNIRRETVLFADRYGELFGEIDFEDSVEDDLLFVGDTLQPWKRLEEIAEYARSIADRYGLPYANKGFSFDECGQVRFYFWEDGDGILCWGETPPENVAAVKQASFVTLDMADRIVGELLRKEKDSGDDEAWRVLEIYCALDFLESFRDAPNEKAAWNRQRSDKPNPEAESAFSNGFSHGWALGAVLKEWQLTRAWGKVVFDYLWRLPTNPPDRTKITPKISDNIVARAKALATSPQNITSASSIAKILEKQLKSEGGLEIDGETIRRELGVRKAEWRP